MPGFAESNITLNFPDNNYFRFSTCKGYIALKGNNFKEMDACWYDQANNTYWLIELKDYTKATLDTLTINKKTWDIVKKAIDSLCMFLSSKHAYPYSGKINPGLPFIPNSDTQFKIFTVVHCDNSKKQDVQLIHNYFRTRFKPYADLFGIIHYGVIEHSKAIQEIPFNIVQ